MSYNKQQQQQQLTALKVTAANVNHLSHNQTSGVQLETELISSDSDTNRRKVQTATLRTESASSIDTIGTGGQDGYTWKDTESAHDGIDCSDPSN